MGGIASSIGKKVASIAAGILLLVVLSWVKGWFRGPRALAGPDGPPVPAGRMVLLLDGADAAVAGVQAWIEHPDSGAVRLVLFAGPDNSDLFVEGPMDLNGDGRHTGKDEFPGDIDDVRSCDLLKGRTFRLKGDPDEWIVLSGVGKCEVVEMNVTPREYWRPKTYDGTDGWRVDVEIRLLLRGEEKTLAGKLEGPVTHVW